MKDWHIGQKIVCIAESGKWDTCPCPRCRNVIFPKKDIVYTIREIIDNGGNNYGFLLEEIHNPQNGSGKEPGFSHTAFRPIQTQQRSTDISVFTKLLTNTKIKEDA